MNTKLLFMLALLIGSVYSAPAIQGVNVQPAMVVGRTAPMQCFVNATEAQVIQLNISYEWYKNDVNTSYGGYANTTANANRSISNLTPSNWAYLQNWSCRVRAFNGSTWSAYLNSTNRTIAGNINTSIIYPPNNASQFKTCWTNMEIQINDSALANSTRSGYCLAYWFNGFANSTYQLYSNTSFSTGNATINISLPVNTTNTSWRFNCSYWVNASGAVNDIMKNNTQIIDREVLGTSFCAGGSDAPMSVNEYIFVGLIIEALTYIWFSMELMRNDTKL